MTAPAPAPGAPTATATATATGPAPPPPSSPSIHVTEWSEAHVAQWLLSLGFTHLAPCFREHGINGDSLVLLDDDNLHEIGVGSVGQRLAILGEIYRLKQSFDIPIEDGDYVPHSAYPTLALPSATASESHIPISNVLSLVQQRNDRIAVLESELSKVTIYLNRLQQDFAQVCQLVGLQKPSSRDAPPIFPFSPMRFEHDPVLLLNPSEKGPAGMGLSSSQQGMPYLPYSANTLSTPMVPLRPSMSGASTVNPTLAPLTGRASIATNGEAAPVAATSTAPLAGTQAVVPTINNNNNSTALAATTAPATATATTTTTALPGFGTGDPENTYRSFRVTLDDPCYRVLPAALKKYKINDDWKKYALIICHGNTERCVTYEEKPLLLFQKLKESKQNPIFMLRHIRDVKNPIALAKAKAEARRLNAATAASARTPTRTGAGVGKVSGKEAQAVTKPTVSSSSAPSTASEEGASTSKAGTPSSGSKVAQTVARFENGSTPRPLTAPLPSGGGTGSGTSTSADSAQPNPEPSTSTSAGAPPSSSDAQPASAPANSSTSRLTGKKSSSAGMSQQPQHPLGSAEWAEAMALRALKNGHDPVRPVLTGAATRLPASASLASVSASASTSASASAGGAAADGTGTSAAASTTPTPTPTTGSSSASGSGSSRTSSLPRKYAIAIYPYPSERDDEFDVELGDTFVVLSKIHGWWAVERDPGADGEGDGRWVELDLPGSREEGRVRVKVVRTGWVPAGCLLEMSTPLAVAVPAVKDRVDPPAAPGAGTGTGESEEKAATLLPADGSAEERKDVEGEASSSKTAPDTTSSSTTTTGPPNPNPNPDPDPDPNAEAAEPQPYMATFPIPPALITSPSTPGIMLMDYTSPPEDRLSLRKNDRLRVFKRYSHWSYCVQEGGSHGRGWVPSWYIGKAYSASSSASNTSGSRRPTGSSRLGLSGGGGGGSGARGGPSSSSSSRSGISSALSSAGAANGKVLPGSSSSSSSKTNGNGNGVAVLESNTSVVSAAPAAAVTAGEGLGMGVLPRPFVASPIGVTENGTKVDDSGGGVGVVGAGAGGDISTDSTASSSVMRITARAGSLSGAHAVPLE
ncbi:hypothetical protein CF335_g6526 [Tilletia laevis]|nr:hypothetical protein CF335_g6526 [Tilletia laevis]